MSNNDYQNLKWIHNMSGKPTSKPPVKAPAPQPKPPVKK